MSTIHLVRHGEVDNPEGILYGRIPGFGLTERGHEMARRVSEHFAEADTRPSRSSPARCRARSRRWPRCPSASVCR